ncbi:Lactoylglutathione lyase [Diplonema papillatum]|nr:Lactoylglutathione lyase [Diplonema papillatum]
MATVRRMQTRFAVTAPSQEQRALKKYVDPPVPVPSLHTVTKRIRDPRLTLQFYGTVFGFRLVHHHKVDPLGFSLLYLGAPEDLRYKPVRTQIDENIFTGDGIRTKRQGEKYPRPGTMDAHDFVFHYHGTLLEFIALHENVDDFGHRYCSGNEPPHLGYGGIGFQVSNLAQTCQLLLQQKNVKILAEPTPSDNSVLVADPDGYAVRIVERHQTMLYQHTKRELPASTLHTCRLRIKDPKQSLAFYQEFFGMFVLCVREHPELLLTRYYLCTRGQFGLDVGGTWARPDKHSDEAWDLVQSVRVTFVELQHHHGTESMSDFQYHSGNVEPLGFAHLGFMVKKIDPLLEQLVENGIYVIKNKGEGAFPQSAYIMDPDGYWIEIYQSCMRDLVIREEGSINRLRER